MHGAILIFISFYAIAAMVFFTHVSWLCIRHCRARSEFSLLTQRLWTVLLCLYPGLAASVYIRHHATESLGVWPKRIRKIGLPLMIGAGLFIFFPVLNAPNIFAKLSMATGILALTVTAAFMSYTQFDLLTAAMDDAKKKTWSLLLFIVPPFSSVIYALFISPTPALKRNAKLWLVVPPVALFLIGVLQFFSHKAIVATKTKAKASAESSSKKKSSAATDADTATTHKKNKDNKNKKNKKNQNGSEEVAPLLEAANPASPNTETAATPSLTSSEVPPVSWTWVQKNHPQNIYQIDIPSTWLLKDNNPALWEFAPPPGWPDGTGIEKLSISVSVEQHPQQTPHVLDEILAKMKKAGIAVQAQPVQTQFQQGWELHYALNNIPVHTYLFYTDQYEIGYTILGSIQNTALMAPVLEHMLQSLRILTVAKTSLSNEAAISHPTPTPTLPITTTDNAEPAPKIIAPCMALSSPIRARVVGKREFSVQVNLSPTQVSAITLIDRNGTEQPLMSQGYMAKKESTVFFVRTVQDPPTHGQWRIVLKSTTAPLTADF